MADPSGDLTCPAGTEEFIVGRSYDPESHCGTSQILCAPKTPTWTRGAPIIVGASQKADVNQALDVSLPDGSFDGRGGLAPMRAARVRTPEQHQGAWVYLCRMPD